MDDKYSAMKNSRAETYPAIDVCKLAMAFLVVMIHVEAIYYLQLNGTMFYVTRTAVPFFFITAGFLLNERMKMSDDALSIMSRYILRIFKMYLFWTAIYAPIAIYMSDCANAVVCVQQLIQYAKGVILVGESYYSWHLWFLLALLVALVSIRLMKQMHFSVVLIFVVGLLLMCLGQMMDRLYADGSSSGFVTALLHKYYALFQNTRNGIFQGISFVSAGMLISEILPPPRPSENVIFRPQIFIKQYGMLILLVFILSLILFHFKIIVWRVLSGMALMMMCICISLPPRSFYIHLRKLSTLIYFSHMYFLFVMSKWIVRDDISVFEMAVFFSCLLLFNVLVLWLINSGNMKWLKQFV